MERKGWTMTPTRRVPEGVMVWKRGSCVPVAMLMAQRLKRTAVIVEGLVRFTTDWQQHTWMEVDGQIFDPTFIQFKRFRGYPNAERQEVKRLTITEYRERTAQVMRIPFWTHRVALFGISPEELRAR